MAFTPLPLRDTPNPAKNSFYFKLALLTPLHYTDKHFYISDPTWSYLTDSHKMFTINWGYYGVAYINIKESKILIAHEGTFFHGISDIFDIIADVQYMLGTPPITHLALSSCFTNSLIVKFPSYKIEHVGIIMVPIIHTAKMEI